MRPIIFDRHARRRMRDRGLSPEEVFLAIREPDKTEPTLKGRRNAFKQLEPQKAIRVTYLEQGGSILVITVVRRKRFPGGEQ
ncbi:MAG: DUF4258 domain-containing protein [Dehalococcoidia bacterium]|nr:DUF4258 domain-containing protein [Dehalococcoidia bacterium]